MHGGARLPTTTEACPGPFVVVGPVGDVVGGSYARASMEIAVSIIALVVAIAAISAWKGERLAVIAGDAHAAVIYGYFVVRDALDMAERIRATKDQGKLPPSIAEKLLPGIAAAIKESADAVERQIAHVQAHFPTREVEPFLAFYNLLVGFNLEWLEFQMTILHGEKAHNYYSMVLYENHRLPWADVKLDSKGATVLVETVDVLQEGIAAWARSKGAAQDPWHTQWLKMGDREERPEPFDQIVTQLNVRRPWAVPPRPFVVRQGASKSGHA